MNLMKKDSVKKALSFVSMFTLLICFMASDMISASAQSVSTPMALTRSSSDTILQMNQQFSVNYKIQPQSVSGPITVSTPKEFYLIIDTSGSMNTNLNGKTRLAVAKQAAINFLNKLDSLDNVKAGLITYDDLASIKCRLTTDFGKVKTAVNKITANTGTNIGDGLRTAYYELIKSNSNADQYIILLTDGQPTYHSIKNDPSYDRRGNMIGEYPYMMEEGIPYRYKGGGSSATFEDKEYCYKVAEELIKTSDIQSYMIAFTTGSDQNILSNIAQKAGGTYKQALDAEALNGVYNEISDSIINDFTIQNVAFEESFPTGLSVLSASEGLTVNGQNVSGNLPSIKYRYNADTSLYEANPIEFSVRLEGNVAGDYVLGAGNTSKMTYKDLDNNTQQLYFDEVNVTVKQINAPITMYRELDKDEIELDDVATVSYNITPESMQIASTNQDKEIVLVFDTSTSMQKGLSGNSNLMWNEDSRETIAKAAALSFIDGLKEKTGVKVALVSFSASAVIRSELTSNLEQIKTEVQALPTIMGTNIGDGLRMAYYILENGSSTAEKFIVLLTDGEPTQYTKKANNIEDYYLGSESAPHTKTDTIKAKEYCLEVVDKLLNTKDINNYFIAFSTRVNALEEAASEAGAQYKEAENAEALNTIYQEISQIVISDYSVLNVQFSEVFPEGLVPVEASGGLVINGQTVTGNLGDISYTYDADSGRFVSNNQKDFFIKLKGSNAGDYILGSGNTSILTYKDINNDNMERYFAELDLTVKDGLFEVSDDVDFNVLGTRRIGEEAIVKISISRPAGATVKLVDEDGNPYTIVNDEVVGLNIYKSYKAKIEYQLPDGTSGETDVKDLYHAIDIN